MRSLFFGLHKCLWFGMDNSGKESTEKKTDGLLAATARVIGKAAGTVASTVGFRESPAPHSAETGKPGKLPKHHKARLPRKQKKAQKASLVAE